MSSFPSGILRAFILSMATLLFQACDRGRDLTVAIHVKGSQVATQRFHSFEKASVWVSQLCEPFWNQAKTTGRSAPFHVVVSGSGLSGVIQSPQFGFESSDGGVMSLIQFDNEHGHSPKIEGPDLQWHSAEDYIRDEIMMVRVFGTHNHKPLEEP